MKVQDDAQLLKEIQSVRAATARRDDHPLRKRADFQQIYEEYGRKLRLGEELEETCAAFEKAKRPVAYEELRARKGLLTRLQYSDNTIKEQVARELGIGDNALVLSEMFFANAFAELTEAEAAALLSCFVFDEEPTNRVTPSDGLLPFFQEVQKFATKVARISKEGRLSVDETAFVDKFKPHLMDNVYEWCSGASFADVCRRTHVYE
ncbi:symbol, partial [Aphelenchoides avenae]